MAQRKRNLTNRGSHRAGTGLSAAGTALALHSVDAPPDTGSLWGRRRVLLLNSTYEPLTALPMRRAIVMLLCGKAEVVHDDPGGPIIHSATRSIAVPSVIRLRVFVRVPYRARTGIQRFFGLQRLSNKREQLFF